jgi:DNA-binding transcriptional regulator PaaX
MPYTEANLKLTFSLKYFIADINKLDNYNQASLRTAYYRCVKRGLIELDEITGQPILTDKALKKLTIYKPTKLDNSKLMVIFDISESDRWKRQQLRALLVQLKFKQVQKSVWASEYDSRVYLKSEIIRLGLSDESVQVYESYRLI